MRAFKEISKNITSLTESLFDVVGDERLGKEIEKDSAQAFLNSCKGNFTPVYFKDGSVRVNGKLIISGLSTDKIYFNCRDFHGKLIIENCPKLETLEGSFLEKFAVFDGSITINQCPSLTTLKGIPGLIKGDLSITNCKKLKSCEGIDMVYGNLYWNGNGKKYDSDTLKGKTHVIKKVFCSCDDIDASIMESLVNEALNNPWLQKLAAQLKKYPFKEYSWRDDDPEKYNKLADIFKYGRTSYSGTGRIFDKMTSEDIDVYDMGDEKDKKELGKAFYNSYSADDANGADIILIYDEDLGEFIGGFGGTRKVRGAQNVGIEWVNIPHKGAYSNKVSSGENYTKTEARDKLLKYGAGYTVVVINTGNNTGTSSSDRYDLKKSRLDLQAGVINPGDAEQYKKIAADNIKRYKDTLAQIKLARKKDDQVSGYDKLIDKFEQINVRVIKLTRAIAKDPKSFDRYDVDTFFHWMRDEKQWNRDYKPWKKNSGPQYYGSNGLMYVFKEFMDAYMRCFGNNSYKTNADESDYKNLEQCAKTFENVIDLADQKLKKFGV